MWLEKNIHYFMAPDADAWQVVIFAAFSANASLSGYRTEFNQTLLHI